MEQNNIKIIDDNNEVYEGRTDLKLGEFVKVAFGKAKGISGMLTDKVTVMVNYFKIDDSNCYYCEELLERVDGNEDTDNVNHPAHYTSHPSGVECIEITRHYCFAIGNAIKYLWRAGLKQEADKDSREKEIEDLQKAVWYINDRIEQLK